VVKDIIVGVACFTTGTQEVESLKDFFDTAVHDFWGMTGLTFLTGPFNLGSDALLTEQMMAVGALLRVWRNNEST
jgi:hypothetical protein